LILQYLIKMFKAGFRNFIFVLVDAFVALL